MSDTNNFLRHVQNKDAFHRFIDALDDDADVLILSQRNVDADLATIDIRTSPNITVAQAIYMLDRIHYVLMVRCSEPTP